MQRLIYSGISSVIWEYSIVKHPEDSPIRFYNLRLVNTFISRCKLFFGDLHLIVSSPGRADGVLFVLDQSQI